MKEFLIQKTTENQRLDKFILRILNDAPSSFVYKMLRKKNIVLNGKKATGNEILQSGDHVIFYLSEETIAKFQKIKEITAVPITFETVFENEDFLLVNKPAGLLSHSTEKQSANTLIDQVVFYLMQKENTLEDFTAVLCNRLDRNTSGIVIAAKTLRGAQHASAALKNRQIKKIYFAMVAGEITKVLHLKSFISKNTKENQMYTNSLGDFAECICEPVKSSYGFSLLKVNLISGRTHQIRHQLQEAGYPVVSDPKYGNLAINQRFHQEFRLKRQFLHAYSLTFPSDFYCKEMANRVFYAKLPEDLYEVKKKYFKEDKS